MSNDTKKEMSNVTRNARSSRNKISAAKAMASSRNAAGPFTAPRLILRAMLFVAQHWIAFLIVEFIY